MLYPNTKETTNNQEKENGCTISGWVAWVVLLIIILSLCSRADKINNRFNEIEKRVFELEERIN